MKDNNNKGSYFIIVVCATSVHPIEINHIHPIQQFLFLLLCLPIRLLPEAEEIAPLPELLKPYIENQPASANKGEEN